MRPSLLACIRWIADEDNPLEMNVQQIQHQLTVQLIADLYNKSPLEIARRIVKQREQHGVR